MGEKQLREIDLMTREEQLGALSLDAINADGYDAGQVSEGIAKAAKLLSQIVSAYCKDGFGLAIINNGDEVSIVGVSRPTGQKEK